MPSTLPRALSTPAICARGAVDVAGVAERDAAFAFQPVERLGVGEVIAVVMRDRDADRLARVIAAGERALRVLDRSSTSRQTKLSPALRISAPGSSPVSVSTWNPLHTPSTGTPRSAASTTARITGDRAAIAPERR